MSDSPLPPDPPPDDPAPLWHGGGANRTDVPTINAGTQFNGHRMICPKIGSIVLLLRFSCDVIVSCLRGRAFF